MDEFGFSSMGLTEKDFLKNGNVIQMGYPPFRIDVLTKPDGVTFDECYQNKILVDYQGLQIAVIGFEDFKKNKKASGRPKDIQDLDNLQ